MGWWGGRVDRWWSGVETLITCNYVQLRVTACYSPSGSIWPLLFISSISANALSHCPPFSFAEMAGPRWDYRGGQGERGGVKMKREL